MERSLVSVIIPNFNGQHLLQGCLDSLRAQTYPSVEIVLIDNGSTDHSISFVRQNYPSVRIIESQSNLGFAKANNLGICASNGEYIFLLNNDTEVDPECIARLVNAIEEDDAHGMCATKIYDFFQRDVIDVAGIAIYPDCSARGRGRLTVDAGQFDRLEEVFGPSGAAGLYRRRMLDEIGLLDEDFFMYCEDTDIAFRGRLAGWKCVFVPKAIVYHMYSATGGKYSPMKAYFVERNRFWTAVKVLPWPELIASFGFSAVRYFFQAVGVVIGRGASGRFAFEQPRFELLKILARAFWSGFTGLPRFMAKRSEVQASRRVGHAEIRAWFRRFGITVQELALRD